MSTARGPTAPLSAPVSQVAPVPISFAAPLRSPMMLPPLPQKIMDSIQRGEYVSLDIIYSSLMEGHAGGR